MVPTTAPQGRQVGVLMLFGQAEVDQLQRAMLAEHAVSGLDISMEDAFRVGEFKAGAQLQRVAFQSR